MNPTTFRAERPTGQKVRIPATVAGQNLNTNPATRNFAVAGPQTAETSYAAADPREVLAMTTSIVRGECLEADGYTVRPTGRPGVVTVTGLPTTSPRTGKTTYHGPYTVDVIGRTCTCPGFAARGVCRHLGGLTDAPQSAEGSGTILGSLLALASESGQLAVTYAYGHPLVYCFRRESDAAAGWAGLTIDGMPAARLTAVAPMDLRAVMASGRYAGLLLLSGARQSVIWFGGEVA